MITMDPNHVNANIFSKWCTDQERSYDIVEGIRVESIASIKQYLTSYGYYTMYNKRETHSHFDTLGPIGCFLAHRRAWMTFLDSDHDYCWILEEGVRSYDTESFQKVEVDYHNFDFIHAHNVFVFRVLKQNHASISTKVQYDDGNIVPINKVFNGTKCYRISRKFAVLLVEHSQLFDVHVDAYICQMAIKHHDVIVSGHLTRNIVRANSSRRIVHSIDTNTTNTIMYMLIISVCILCTIVIYWYYRRCKQTVRS